MANKQQKAIVGEPALPAGLTQEDLDLQPASKGKKASQDDYEEWKCEVRVTKDPNDDKKVVRNYEKLKCVRKTVKITEAEANTLNHGHLYGAESGIILMYFKPGEE